MQSVCEPNFDDDLEGGGGGKEGSSGARNAMPNSYRRSLVQKNKSKSKELSKVILQIQLNDPSLTSLNLHQKNINDEFVIPLLDALIPNKVVRELMLTKNRIGNEGCSALAAMILDNGYIRKIDLRGNNIRYFSSVAIRYLGEGIGFIG